ncbi:SNF2-related protein [Sutterella sp.]|uniref:SNF2-related protein n=1 Tax=Sutterella sp. TaxID=1981025 RepID=UPI0026E0045B|nr:SNF2-related protein [Sutterella sp.]MDO5532095.1 SNF2-related protein [Sutterella sp.]
MATRREYGTTWWGSAWLAALERVDEANRIPRGKSYANTGRVRQITLDPTTRQIDAVVQGTVPYEVSFSMKPVAKTAAAKLLDRIAADPDLIAELLDGRIPPEVADICDELGIEFFPRSSRSFKVRCSCPDSARICKHIAAVFYMIADQIDVDPFFIFRFRGLDLKRGLKERGIDLDAAVKVRPLPAAELFARAETSLVRGGQPARREFPAGDEFAEAGNQALAELRSIPYRSLTPLLEVIVRLFPESVPISSNRDCRGFVRTILTRAAKGAKAAVALASEPDASDRPASAAAGFEAFGSFLTSEMEEDEKGSSKGFPGFTEAPLPLLNFAKKDLDPAVALIPSAVSKARGFMTELHFIIPALARIPARDVQLMDPVFECWREIALASARLVAEGAVVPAVEGSSEVEDCCPRLAWLPAVGSPAVRSTVLQLARGIAPWARDLVCGEAADICAGSPERTALLCLSAAIAGWMGDAMYRWLRRPDPSDIFEALMLSIDLSEFDGRIDPIAGESLARVLKHFTLADAYPWQPVLTVRSAPKGGIRVNFGILSRSADMAKATETALAAPDDDAEDEIEFPDDPAASVEGLPKDRPLLFRTLMKNERWSAHRYAALSVLRALGRESPQIDAIRVNKGKPGKLALTELKDFLFDTAPLLAILGVTVMLPNSMRKLLRPTLTGAVSTGKGFAKSLLSRDALAEFDWRVSIGGREMSEEEFLALADAHAGEIVQMGEDFVYLDPEEINRIRRSLETPPKLTPLEKMRAVLLGEFEGMPVEVSPEVKLALEHITEVTDVPPPQGLTATLRPYQERGYSWLMKNMGLGMGALIADDMGLGKTLQVISAILELRNRGELKEKRVLAVVPTTLITNWTREIAKFAPSLTCGVYHGADRSLPAPKDLPDVTLTSYGTLRRDFEFLSERRWKLVVLDEAQAIKNVTSAQTAAVRGLKTELLIAMTGTPVENRLMEYWSILSAVQPRILGTQKDFSETFAKPIEADHDPQAVEAFRRLTAPFMLRRLKSDKSIIADLPEKNTIDHFTTMHPEQAALYAKTLKKMMDKIRELENAEDANTLGGRLARRGMVLKLITSLKQICNSPSQFMKTEAPLPDSGKGDALLEVLGECAEADRKVLIFTQYREMGERLQKWIAAATGAEPEFLHGGVPAKRRQEMVDRFQTDRSSRILILSLKAGGTGLNLTAASAVIHYDLWWNPAVEAQATDRAFRIGQRRDVLVWRFITAATFEERINDMLESKRDLAEMTVTTGESWIGDLPTEELNRIFALPTK